MSEQAKKAIAAFLTDLSEQIAQDAVSVEKFSIHCETRDIGTTRGGSVIFEPTGRQTVTFIIKK